MRVFYELYLLDYRCISEVHVINIEKSAKRFVLWRNRNDKIDKSSPSLVLGFAYTPVRHTIYLDLYIQQIWNTCHKMEWYIIDNPGINTDHNNCLLRTRCDAGIH